MAQEPATITVTLTRACVVGGKPQEVGSFHTLPPSEGRYLISLNKAVEGKQDIKKPEKKATKVEAPAPKK